MKEAGCSHGVIKAKAPAGSCDPTGAFAMPPTGVEPVLCLQKGILSPSCLPISPQRRTTLIIIQYNPFFVKKNCKLRPFAAGSKKSFFFRGFHVIINYRCRCAPAAPGGIDEPGGRMRQSRRHRRPCRGNARIRGRAGNKKREANRDVG